MDGTFWSPDGSAVFARDDGLFTIDPMGWPSPV
jgi:hypothetical protein